MNINNSNVSMSEIREALVLAEQLAKESIEKGTTLSVPISSRTRSRSHSPRPNRNGVEIPEKPGGFVPPKQLLLYLVRMGSFSSKTKIENEDSQDDGVEFPSSLTASEMLDICHNELSSHPAMVTREHSVLKPRSDSSSVVIKIMQWNILSQSLGMYNDKFVCVPEDALMWSTRRYRILEGIADYDPDVVCLQEVDHYKFLEKALGSLGYEGVFFPKPDSPCYYIAENNGPDGCAIFFKKSKFDLVDCVKRIIEVWRVQSNQVVVMANLSVKGSGKEFSVVTTHLKARQGALLSALRQEQGKDVLNFIQCNRKDRPVIVCGDFNAECSEPVYSVMTTNPTLPLSSAYYQKGNKEPLYTTWKIREEGEICHTIDYIFYSRGNFDVLSLLNLPSAEQIGEDRVPSYSYPSDHFSLVSELELLS